MKQKSDEIRGDADAQVIQMTAAAYSKNPDFFQFLEQLKVYEAVFQKDTRLILSTDSEMLQLLNGQSE